MQPDSRTRLKQWLERGEARLHPLSFPQRELWENSPVPVDSPANHICSVVELKGALNEKKSLASVQQVVDRQGALRTSFLPGKHRPLQLVRASTTAIVHYRELSTAEFQPEALADLLRQSFSQPFDLLQGPLYRAEVLRRSAEDHLLVFSIHHAIADGWSLGVFVQDLCAAYLMGLTGFDKTTSLPPVPQSYTDWAAAEHAFWQPAELKVRADYWKNKLAGARQLLPAANSLERARQPLERWVSSLPQELTGAVRELSRRHGATLFSALLAAFQVTLFKWTREDDLIVGTPVANRNTASSRQTVGYFSGVVPLRGWVDPTRTLTDHLKVVHETAVDGFANAMPFAELAAALEEPRAEGLHSIFDVRFALHNHPTLDVTVPRISTRLRMRSSGTARFDLACEITERGKELEVVWLFKSPVFTPASIPEIHKLFRQVLAKSCHSPQSRIAEVSE